MSWDRRQGSGGSSEGKCPGGSVPAAGKRTLTEALPRLVAATAALPISATATSEPLPADPGMPQTQASQERISDEALATRAAAPMAVITEDPPLMEMPARLPAGQRVLQRKAAQPTLDEPAHPPPRAVPRLQLKESSPGTTPCWKPSAAGWHLEPPSVQRKATADTAPDGASAADIAQRGLETGGGQLPHLERIQASFGPFDISGVTAHQGPAAEEASAKLGAEAYTTGDAIAFSKPPDLHTAAHEAAHVVQQRGGVQLKGGIDGGTGDPYERHADAVADRVVAGRSAEDLLGGGATGGATHTVQRKEAKGDGEILESQARLKNTDVEIPALEGALLATRMAAVKQGLLSQASFDAGLALSQAMTQLQPAVAAKGAVDKGLQENAALAAQRLFAAMHAETAADNNFHISLSQGESTAVASENPYTGEAKLTTSFIAWSSTHDMGSRFEQLPGLIRQAKWDDAFRGYREMLDGLDRWVADQLRSKGKGTPEEARGNAHQHHAQLRSALEPIAGKHATRLPAVFHPDAKTIENEKADGHPVADTIPMNVYFWKDEDGKVHLYDLTTPGRPQEQTIDGPPTVAMMSTFFEEVARYPEGEVRYTLPGGASGVAPTTGKIKWFEWIGYAGLAVAAAGLALLTAGASIPATVCFAAGALAGGISAGGHLVDSERLGTATSATVVLDVAQIVASFASLGAMSITVKAGGAAAALASSRWFVPLAGTAAGADVVQLVVLTDITFAELSKIQNGAGTPEDKQRAMAVLFTQLIVAGGLTALSVQGARNARLLAGKQLELVEQNGAPLLRVAGDSTPEPATRSGTSTAEERMTMGGHQKGPHFTNEAAGSKAPSHDGEGSIGKEPSPVLRDEKPPDAAHETARRERAKQRLEASRKASAEARARAEAERLANRTPEQELTSKEYRSDSTQLSKAEGKRFDVDQATIDNARTEYQSTYEQQYLEARRVGVPEGQAATQAKQAATARMEEIIQAKAAADAPRRALADARADTHGRGVPDAFGADDAIQRQNFRDIAPDASGNSVRGQTARAISEELVGKTVAEMEMIAKARGGVRSPSAGVKQVLSNRKVEGKPVLNPDGAPETYGQIEYNFPDGTRVRIKPNGDMMSSTDPMYSVELTHPDAPRRGMPQESIAFKYDAGGHPVPKGPQDIRNPYPDGTAAHKAYQDALIQAGHLHGGTDANPSIAKPTQSPSSTQPLGN